MISIWILFSMFNLFLCIFVIRTIVLPTPESATPEDVGWFFGITMFLTVLGPIVFVLAVVAAILFFVYRYFAKLIGLPFWPQSMVEMWNDFVIAKSKKSEKKS